MDTPNDVYFRQQNNVPVLHMNFYTTFVISRKTLWLFDSFLPLRMQNNKLAYIAYSNIHSHVPFFADRVLIVPVKTCDDRLFDAAVRIIDRPRQRNLRNAIIIIIIIVADRQPARTLQQQTSGCKTLLMFVRTFPVIAARRIYTALWLRNQPACLLLRRCQPTNLTLGVMGVSLSAIARRQRRPTKLITSFRRGFFSSAYELFAAYRCSDAAELSFGTRTW